MNILSTATQYSAEDFERYSGDRVCELVDGQLLEKGMGARSGRVGGIIFRRIDEHAEAHRLGKAFPAETGYQCFARDLNRVRKPDASLVRTERMPAGGTPRGWFRIPPDLAVEVISPNDLAAEVAARVVDYLNAGTSLVWVVDPESEFVQVFRKDGSGAWLIGSGELSGEDVLPGFRCRIEDIFAGI